MPAQIISCHTGMALEAEAWHSGANVRGYSYWGGDWQHWRIEGLEDFPGTYYIKPRYNPDLAVDQGWSTTQGTNVSCAEFTGMYSQRWAIVNTGYTDSQGRTLYKIVSAHCGQVLSLNGCASDDGTNVHQWGDIGAFCQKFIVYLNPNGCYSIVSDSAGKALDVDQASGNVQIWWNGHADNQTFHLELVW